MNRGKRLYNVILPIWMLWIFPKVWLVVLPGNLAIDCLVLFFSLAALGCKKKGAVLRQVWWKIWLLGFAADAVGTAWMFLGFLPIVVMGGSAGWWEENIAGIMGSPFRTPLALVWTLIGIAAAGVCIYFWDRRLLRSCPELDERTGHIAALVLAVVTAPWTFFIPLY